MHQLGFHSINGGNALYSYVKNPQKQVYVLGLSGLDPFAVGEIIPFPKDIHSGQNRIAPKFSVIGSQASDKIAGRSVAEVGNPNEKEIINPNEFLIYYTVDPSTGKAIILNNRGLAALSIGEKVPDNASCVLYEKAPKYLVADFKYRSPSKTISRTADKAGKEV